MRSIACVAVLSFLAVSPSAEAGRWGARGSRGSDGSSGGSGGSFGGSGGSAGGSSGYYGGSGGSAGGSSGYYGGSGGSVGGSSGYYGGSGGSSGGSSGHFGGRRGLFGSSGGAYGSGGSSGGSSGAGPVYGSSGGAYGSSGGSAGTYAPVGGISTGSVFAAPVAPVVQSVPDRAYLVMHVPADATVYMLDQKMTMTGEVRSFVTPKLEQNKVYAVNVRVEWERDGQKYVARGTQKIRPGDKVAVEARLSSDGSALQLAQKEGQQNVLEFTAEAEAPKGIASNTR